MSRIDETEYVEASDGQKSLRFGDDKQQARFELGVCMAVYKWEELNTAVDNSWGGPNSNDKRDWISGIVIELFDEKTVDVQLIEETLLYAMLDEFETHVDNDSALEIASLVMKIYKQVAQQEYALVEELYNKWQLKQQNRQINKVKVTSDPENPSSDEEDDTENQDDNDMQIDEQPKHQEPVVDDDGFTLVQRRR